MYFNTLIIMNEGALGYGNRSRKPSGYCKLTMPNRVVCYVQGLRQLPKGQIYRLYLTSKSQEQSIEVGMFQVGANGSKETRWVMNPASINNSGVSADEIDGALIIVDGESIKDNIVPLLGFSVDPYAWEHLVDNKKEILSQKVDTKPVAVEPTKPVQKEISVAQVSLMGESSRRIEPEAIEVEETPKVEEREKVVEPMGMTHTIQQVKVDIEQETEVLSLKEEIQKLKCTIEESQEIIKELKKGLQNSLKPAEPEIGQLRTNIEVELEKPELSNSEPVEKVEGINDYINNFIRKFQTADKREDKVEYAEMEDLFKKRIPINPFEVNNAGVKWVRITHEDLNTLPLLDYEWTNQPLVMDANKDYKHFILGRDEIGLTYYVGIPGIFDPNQDTLRNIDKIERFSCCHNRPPKAGEAGYWIARI